MDVSEISKRVSFPVGYADYTAYRLENPCVSTRMDMGLGEDMVAGLSLFDTDQLVWFGDLNYRIALEAGLAKPLLEVGNFQELMTYDQLNKERSSNKVFKGFLEHPVAFNPTYKYDIGSSQFDSRYFGSKFSEKKRAPAWCDRILYLNSAKNLINVRSYSTCMELTESDHKPVYSLMEMNARIIDEAPRKLILNELSRDLDRLENDARPKVEIAPASANFGPIFYKVQSICRIVVHNVGMSSCKFHISAPGNLALPGWLSISPMSGRVPAGRRRLT